MSKKILSVILAAVMLIAVSLTGCSGKNEGNTPSDTPQNTKADDSKESADSGNEQAPDANHVSVPELKEKLATFKAGDTFTIGVWDQDGEDKNGVEPIEWTVIAQGVGKAFVLTTLCLEYMPFCENTTDEDDRWFSARWPESTLRTWLNNEFINTAFSDEERALIETQKRTLYYIEDYEERSVDVEDKVFEPTLTEAWRYIFPLGNLGYGEPTEKLRKNDRVYMSSVSENDEVEEAMGWWLCNSGDNASKAAEIPPYSKSPDSYGSEVASSRGVRPAMWIVYDEALASAYEKGEAKPAADAQLDATIAALKIGDKLTFGAYPLRPYASGEYSPLEWTVVDEDDESLTIVMNYTFTGSRFMTAENLDDVRNMEEMNWAISTLRQTLNSSELIDSLFTPQEKAKILLTHVVCSGDDMWNRTGGDETDDYIFIPDKTDLDKYGEGLGSEKLPELSFWLRTPSFVSPNMTSVYYGSDDYVSISTKEASDYTGVRPMMRIEK